MMFHEEYRDYAEKFLERLQQDLYAETSALQASFALTGEHVPFEKHNALSYHPVKPGETWGHSWEKAWFRLHGTIPESWAGKEVVLLLNLSGEILLYDEKGNALAGLCSGTVYSPSYLRERYFLTSSAAGGEKVTFIAEASANSLIGVVMDNDPGLKTPHPYGHYEGTVRKMELALFRRDVWQLRCDVEILLSAMKSLPKEDCRSKLLLTAVMKAAHIYSGNPENASSARAALQKVLSFPATASALKVRAMGHAHIDIGWLWPVRESTHKAARTFATQLDLMERYPDYIFGASQPALYAAVKEHYPELYDRIKQAVKAGKWELLGGMWVEADVNLSGSESLVRQFLYGKNFFMDEFGVDVKNLWLPDAFGYSASLPQIIKRSGCDFFLSQKLSWNKHNVFPFHTFLWKGIDGSRVLAHFPPENNYCATVHPKDYAAAANRFNESCVCDGFISLFGFGDGGGGPDADHLERLSRLKNWEFSPSVFPARAEDFLADQKQFATELPEYAGELYLEMHRGTFTTQAKTKYLNRKCEQLICAVEMLSCQLPVSDGTRKFFEKSWKTILLNQFHDILPGSSIGEVYRQTETELGTLRNDLMRQAEKTAEQIFEKDKDSLVLFNSLAHPFSGIVELPETWRGRAVLDERGNAVPVQTGSDAVYADVMLPSNSFVSLKRADSDVPDHVEKSMDMVLENELIRYRFSAEGRLISAFDKERQREVLAGEGNLLSLYCDRSLNFQAWDIDPYYRKEKVFDLQMSFHGKAQGEVFSQLEFSASFSSSSLKQKIRLGNHSRRLDFVTEVNWNEDFKMLRVAFPVDIVAKEAVFDIQAGYLRRPSTSNSSIEMSAYETVGHRYADLSESNYGAALLNDCKYGYSVKGNTLDLALLRAPKFPDFDADLGRHEFVYSFHPHTGDTVDSDTIMQAAMLNRAPLCFDGFSTGKAKPFCHLESDNGSIVLEAVKTAEKSDAYIVRVSEAHGQRSKGKLHFNSGNYRISVTDLVEWKENELMSLPEDGSLEIELRPFEIRTFRVIPD